LKHMQLTFPELFQILLERMNNDFIINFALNELNFTFGLILKGVNNFGSGRQKRDQSCFTSSTLR